MSKVYVVETQDNGTTCVFDNKTDAQYYVLRGLMEDARTYYGREPDGINTFVTDIKTLFEHGYVDDYAWIIEADLNPDVEW